MPEPFAFSSAGTQRIVGAVRTIEGQSADLTGLVHRRRRTGGSTANGFPVIVDQPAGDAGSATSYCTYTYRVKSWPDGASILAENVAVLCSRARSIMVACMPGTVGWAFRDADGIKLWDVNETVSQVPCQIPS